MLRVVDNFNGEFSIVWKVGGFNIFFMYYCCGIYNILIEFNFYIKKVFIYVE